MKFGIPATPLPSQAEHLAQHAELLLAPALAAAGGAGAGGPAIGCWGCYQSPHCTACCCCCCWSFRGCIASSLGFRMRCTPSWLPRDNSHSRQAVGVKLILRLPPLQAAAMGGWRGSHPSFRLWWGLGRWVFHRDVAQDERCARRCAARPDRRRRRPTDAVRRPTSQPLADWEASTPLRVVWVKSAPPGEVLRLHKFALPVRRFHVPATEGIPGPSRSPKSEGRGYSRDVRW